MSSTDTEPKAQTKLAHILGLVQKKKEEVVSTPTEPPKKKLKVKKSQTDHGSDWPARVQAVVDTLPDKYTVADWEHSF